MSSNSSDCISFIFLGSPNIVAIPSAVKGCFTPFHNVYNLLLCIGIIYGTGSGLNNRF